ncbi:MAG: hypothetical protein IPM42_17735 [Saprospiraceae bacterium]|nr:hypothetical protein [Saprospiraceae bacterium]
MRTALFIILLIHGLIHIIGFTKAFGLYDAKQLTQPISKPIGIIWLMAFLLLFIASVLFIIKNNNWWFFGIIAVVISQILIFNFWQDSKFGTIANVIILLASIIGFGTWSYYKDYKNDLETCLQQKEYFHNTILSETDIQSLPEPVKKYIRYSGCIGKPKVNNFKIEFEGKIRKDEQSEWMPFT